MKAKHVEAMKLALEALESCDAAHITDGGHQWYDEKLVDTAYAALRSALAEQPAQQCKWPTCQSEEYQQALAEQIKRELVGEQPAQQEPVGYVAENGLVDWNVCAPPMMTDLYASPPAQRKPLTDEEVDRLWSQSMADTAGETYLPLREFARAIEAAHGLKENT